MKFIQNAWALLSGKKRAIGGVGYVIIDVLASSGAIPPEFVLPLKSLAGSIFGVGVGHAVTKAKV